MKVFARSILIGNNQLSKVLSLDFFESAITQNNPFPLYFLALCRDKVQLNKIILKIDQVNISETIVASIYEELNRLKQVKSFIFISTIKEFTY